MMSRDMADFNYRELLQLVDDLQFLHDAQQVDQNDPFVLKALTVVTFVKHKILEDNNV